METGNSPAEMRENTDKILSNIENKANGFKQDIKDSFEKNKIDEETAEVLTVDVDRIQGKQKAMVKESSNVKMENTYGDGPETADYVYPDNETLFAIFFLLPEGIVSILYIIIRILLNKEIRNSIYFYYNLGAVPNKVIRIYSLLVKLYNYVINNKISLYLTVAVLGLTICLVVSGFNIISCDAPRA
jgi:hypothetical protein